jgi:uncharacterized protein
MIRAILLFILMMVIYRAVKTLFRSAAEAYRRDDRAPGLPGAEMVRDPQCGTYIVKERAVTRRIGGQPTHFCSPACAEAYERQKRV